MIHGKDAFLRDHHRRRIVDELVGQADRQLCVRSFEARAELVTVLDELRTLPLLAPCRVAIIADADEFVSAHRKGLEAYLLSPCGTGHLVLMVSSWPTTTRLYKRVQKVGQAVDCAVPDEQAVRRWLKNAVAKRGKAISPEAAEVLVESTGLDLAALDTEVDKLSTYAGRREQITVEDVSALVTATAGPAAFALADALITGQTSRALAVLDGLLTGVGEEFRTLGLIAWHLRRVIRAQALLQAGTPTAEVLRSCKVFRNKEAFLDLLKRRPISQVQRDFRRLILADVAMKSGAKPAVTMRGLVMVLSV